MKLFYVTYLGFFKALVISWAITNGRRARLYSLERDRFSQHDKGRRLQMKSIGMTCCVNLGHPPSGP